MKILAALLTASLVSACVTTKGTYSITAYDMSGRQLSGNVALIAFGSGIYSSISALCKRYPNAVIIIRDTETGKQLDRESPHSC